MNKYCKKIRESDIRTPHEVMCLVGSGNSKLASEVGAQEVVRDMVPSHGA